MKTKLRLHLKAFCFSVLCLFTIPLTAQTPDYFQQIETGYYFTWNTTTQSWNDHLNMVYEYNASGQIINRTTINAVTGEPVSRILYDYSEGKLLEYFFENRVADDWVLATKYILGYDEFGRLNSLLVLNNINGELQIRRWQTDYIYNEPGQLEQFSTFSWNGTSWVLGDTEYYSYNEIGNLINSYTFNSSGNIVGRIFFYYNINNQRTGFITQMWVASTQTWRNGRRDTYTYNSCGLRIQLLREWFRNNDWVYEFKEEYNWKVYFNNPRPGRRIPVCHNGRTIYVSPKAVPAFLKQGSCLGECVASTPPVETEKPVPPRGNLKTSESVQFYPNPATESINVFAGESFSRVELINSNGQTVRAFPLQNGDLTVIERNGLPSGIYFLRFVGQEEVKTEKVIFR